MDFALLSTAEVAALGDRAMPGLERAALGDWTLRYGLGETRRANSAMALGSPGLPAPDAIDRVESWYGERGGSPTFQVFDEADTAVVTELDRRGYGTEAWTEIRIASVAAVLAVLPTKGAFGLEVATAMPPFLRQQLPPARATEMLAARRPRWFAIASQRGAACAAGMALEDGPHVGVFAMRTQAGHRGQGAGAAVLRALLSEGRRRGAHIAWLQVEAANEPAQSWYTRLGFSLRARYCYRVGGAPST